MHPWPFLLILAVAAAFACAAGCASPSSPPVAAPAGSPAVTADQAASPAVTPGSEAAASVLRVGTLGPGATLPAINTCTGAGETPEVSWSGIPAGTKSLVLILDDPDAPGGTFTHWIVYNIPPAVSSISRAQPNQKVLDNGANVGENSGGSRGYYPPCPPVGSTHRYIFRLYAVDADLTLPTAGRDAIDQAMSGHILETTTFATTSGR